MILPTLRQLEYFIGIVDQGSFRAAAEACFVTQPALSSQIQQLERTLGIELFERSGRRAHLSEAGRRLLPRARTTIQAARDLVSDAQGLGEPLTGTLRLGVIPTVAPYLLPKLTPEVRKRYPDLRLLLHEAQTETLVRRLHNGELDLLLLALDVPLDGATELELFEDPFHLAVPREHPLAKRSKVARSQLRELDLLLLEDGHCLRDHAFEACQLDAKQEVDDFRATSLNTLVRMVASGLGSTLLPEMALDYELRDRQELHLLRIEDPTPSRRIGLAWRDTNPRKKEFGLFAELLALLS